VVGARDVSCDVMRVPQRRRAIGGAPMHARLPAAQLVSRRSRRCPKCRTSAGRKPLVQAKQSYIED